MDELTEKQKETIAALYQLGYSHASMKQSPLTPNEVLQTYDIMQRIKK